MQKQHQSSLATRVARPDRATPESAHQEHPLLQLQHTIGNQAVQRMMQARVAEQKSRTASPPPGTGIIQKKLTINEPGDEFEQEADHVAEQVMRMPDTHLSLSDGEDEAKNALMCKPASQTNNGNATGTHSAPPLVHEVLNSDGGQPLDAATRAFMEPRFGRDFSQVRVHTDAKAAESATAINAAAYTAGRDVVFGQGQYTPHSQAGRKLLAHELTHVAQQQTTNRAAVARQNVPQPAQQFQTNVAVLDQAEIEKWSRISYWFQRIGSLFQISLAPETAERFKKDEEERDAVLAALWRILPAPNTLTSQVEQYVKIPSAARPQKKQPGEVMYRFVFYKDKNGKQTVEIHFETENPTGVVTFAPNPPAGSEKEIASLDTPLNENTKFLHYHLEGSPPDYLEQHPEEQKQIFYWVAKQGRSFEQIIITTTTERKGETSSVKHSQFLIRGSKDEKGQTTDLSIKLLGKTFHLSEVWLPDDYHRKDAADALLQEIQEQPDLAKKDLLGKVTLGNVPTEEIFPLKYTIWAYFRMGTRNAEVDAIITIVGTGRRIFYTLHFRQNNDVDVERIGEEGKEAKLDPNRLDIAWVNGFTPNADDPKKLKSWLQKRYPGIKPVGNDPISLRDNANKDLRAEVGTPAWFEKNYQIRILDQGEGKKALEEFLVAEMKGRRKRTPGIQPFTADEIREQLADIQPFTSDELKLLEFALEPMSEKILNLLKGARLMRQKVDITFNEANRSFSPRPDIQGKTLTLDKHTVIIFDSAMKNNTLRFLGGVAGVRPESDMTFTHELGHVVQRSKGIGAEFNRFVKDQGIQPFTPYAMQDPANEFFSEAFYLYETDPEWLKSNQPEVFAWFEALSKEGRPPARKK